MDEHRIKFPFSREKYSGPLDGELVDDVLTWRPGTRRAQPAQAVPMLTDDAIRQIADACDDGQEDAEYTLAFARRVEQAVRAKLGVAVPMTLKQIIHLTDEIPLHEGGGWFVDVVRAAERFHGIVGKEGA